MTPPVHTETPASGQADQPRPRPIVNPGMLMTIGHYHGYPALRLKPGVSIAEGAVAWRTFTRDSADGWLELAAAAARTAWPDDPMVRDLYYTPLSAEHEETPAALADFPDSEHDDAEDDENESLATLLAGCCTPGKPCGDHSDDDFEAHRDAQLDRHLEGGR